MADTKVSALTNIGAVPDYADELYIVDDPGGTPVSKAITYAYLGSTAINAQTDTAHTLALTDQNNTVTMDNASANTLTIPTNASVAWQTGAQVAVWQKGAGVTTITADTGVTLNGVSAGSGAINSQYKAIILMKVDTNTWLMTGDHAVVA